MKRLANSKYLKIKFCSFLEINKNKVIDILLPLVYQY